MMVVVVMMAMMVVMMGGVVAVAFGRRCATNRIKRRQRSVATLKIERRSCVPVSEPVVVTMSTPSVDD